MDLVALHPLAAGALPWRTSAGTHRLTVIVKATYLLRHGDLATPVEPLPLFEDAHYDQSGSATLMVASDYALRKPLADVYFTGSAYAPGGKAVPSFQARLALDAPEGNLFDKTIDVLGERKRGGLTGAVSKPAKIARVPMRYELAAGGPSSLVNPIGAGEGAGARLPSLVHPRDEAATACFAPMAASVGARARRIFGDPRLLRAMPVLDAAFDFGFFNAAPEDQRVRHLTALEEVRLYGLHPTLQEVRSRLPGLRAHAMLDLGTQRASVRLVADTLWIEGDTMRACLTSRGDLEVTADLAEGRVPFRLLVTLARIHERPTWGPTMTPSMLPPPAAAPSMRPPLPATPAQRPSSPPPAGAAQWPQGSPSFAPPRMPSFPASAQHRPSSPPPSAASKQTHAELAPGLPPAVPLRTTQRDSVPPERPPERPQEPPTSDALIAPALPIAPPERRGGG